MSKAKYVPEEILSSIKKLPEESLGELVDFIGYLQYKNSSAKTSKRKITLEESEQMIEEILTEVGESIPSLSDYAVSRAGIYEDHP